MGLETEFRADLQRFDFEVKFLLRRRRPNNQIWEIVTWFWQIHVTTLCLNSLWDDSLTIKYMTDWDVIDWAARLHHFILRHPSIKDKEYFLCWNNHSKQFIFSNIYLMFLFLQLHYVRQSPLLRIYWGSIGPWCSLPKSISVFVPLQESLLDKDGIMLNNLFLYFRLFVVKYLHARLRWLWGHNRCKVFCVQSQCFLFIRSRYIGDQLGLARRCPGHWGASFTLHWAARERDIHYNALLKQSRDVCLRYTGNTSRGKGWMTTIFENDPPPLPSPTFSHKSELHSIWLWRALS